MEHAENFFFFEQLHAENFAERSPHLSIQGPQELVHVEDRRRAYGTREPTSRIALSS